MAKKPEKTKISKKELSPSFFRKNVFELIIFAFCFLLYSNSLFNGYNMDDELVTRNHRLTSKGISAIPEIFISPYYQDEMGYAYEYRPIPLATFAIEHSFFGDNPFVSHFFNLLLYAVVCCVIFRFLISAGGAFTPFIAFCISLLFCAHPSHTEVVNSIKNRDEILGLLFCAISSQTALIAARKKNMWLMVVSGVWFLFAILCKSTFVPFSFFIPLGVILFTESTLTFTIPIALLLSLVSCLLLDINPAHYKLWFVFSLLVTMVAAHWVVRGASIRAFVSFFKKQEFRFTDEKTEESFSSLRQWWSDFNKTSFYSLLPTAIILFVYFLGCVHNTWLLPLVIILVLIGSVYLDYRNFKYWSLGLGLLLCIAILGIEMFNNSNTRLYGSPHLRMLIILLFPVFLAGKHTIRLPLLILAIVMGIYLSLNQSIGDLFFVFILFLMGSISGGRKMLLVFTVFLFCLIIKVVAQNGWLELTTTTSLSLDVQFVLALLLLNLFRTWTYVLKKIIFVFAFVLLLMSSFFVYQFSHQIKNGITTTIYNDKDYLNLVKTVVETNTDRPLSYVEYPLPSGTSNDIKMGTSLVVLGHYLEKTLWPYPLSFYYGYAFIKPTSFKDPTAIIFGTTYLLLILTVLFLLRKSKNISFGLIIYLLSVLTFSGYFLSVPGIVADRYLLVPSFGWSIVLTLLLLKFCKVKTSYEIKETMQVHFHQLPKSFVYILSGILCGYSCLTFSRNFDWKDDLTLFRHDIKYVNNSSQAHNLLAIHLMKHSFDIADTSGQSKIRNEALGHFKSAIEIYPPFYNVAFDLGRTYATLNMPDSAVIYFKRAIAIDSSNSDAHLFVAKLLVETKHYEEAIPFFEYRINKLPTDYASYETLSYIYFIIKKYPESISVNKKAVSQFSALPDPLINIGRTFMAMNEKDSARVYFQKALVVSPNNTGIIQLLQPIAVK